MKHILFPTDFSPVSENALTYCLHLAEKMGARITLLHAHHYMLVDTDVVPAGMIEALELEEENTALREFQRYESLLQSKLKKNVEVSHRLSYGFAKDQILQMARDEKADMIVMGTTGAASVIDKLLGSVTSGVISEASCPVLAVPREARFHGIEHMMFATGFDKLEMDIFERLYRFARSLNARISCVHIHDPDRKWDLMQLEFFNKLFKEKIETEQIDFFLHNAPDILDGLEGFIKEHKVDLLVMLTQKRDLFNRIFNPSLTRKMALASHVPLLALSHETAKMLA